MSVQNWSLQAKLIFCRFLLPSCPHFPCFIDANWRKCSALIKSPGGTSRFRAPLTPPMREAPTPSWLLSPGITLSSLQQSSSRLASFTLTSTWMATSALTHFHLNGRRVSQWRRWAFCVLSKFLKLPHEGAAEHHRAALWPQPQWPNQLGSSQGAPQWPRHSPVRYIDMTYRLSIYRHFWKISISISMSIWSFLKISISISIRQFQKYRYRHRYRYGGFGKYRYRYRYR